MSTHSSLSNGRVKGIVLSHSRTPTCHEIDAGHFSLMSTLRLLLIGCMEDTPASYFKDLADYSSPPSPAQLSRLHDQHLSLLIHADDRVVHTLFSDPHSS